MDTQTRQEEKVGRYASAPWRLPWRGWRAAVGRTIKSIGSDNVPIVAAGVAFYSFLSLFPMLIAVISLYGIFATPAEAQSQVNALAEILPAEARAFLNEQLTRLAAQAPASLGWKAALGLLVALWSSSRAVKNMMVALNIAYDESENRNFLKQNLVGLGLTALIALLFTVALAFILIAPLVIEAVPLGPLGKDLIALSRWPALLALALAITAALYRWGPNRRSAQFRWISPGAVFATTSWILASWAFSFFVSRFANYSETYGPVTSVIILLTWFMLTTNLLLIGAELNCELERQTKLDSTVGEDRPLGQRGAYAADTVGGAPPAQPEDRRTPPPPPPHNPSARAGPKTPKKQGT